MGETEFVPLKQQGVEQARLTRELQERAEQMEAEIFQRAQELQEANQKLRAQHAVTHLLAVAEDFEQAGPAIPRP